jgi:hypothetical protein
MQEFESAVASVVTYYADNGSGSRCGTASASAVALSLSAAGDSCSIPSGDANWLHFSYRDTICTRARRFLRCIPTSQVRFEPVTRTSCSTSSSSTCPSS